MYNDSGNATCCGEVLREGAHLQVMELMSRGIETIPEGNSDVIALNLAYNSITALPNNVFTTNNYTRVRSIMLHQNRIANVSVNAFKDLREVTEIDLSDNLLTAFDPYTFKWNRELKKLIVMNNFLTLGRRQTFILSYSLEHLMLSNNKIEQIYELNFLGLPNLKTLFLNGNELTKIAPNSFRTLNKLRYISLENTGVLRLGPSTFSLTPPRILNVDGTPLASRFDPPLTLVSGESVVRLLELSGATGDDGTFATL